MSLYVAAPGNSFDSEFYDAVYSSLDVFEDIGINGPGAVSRIEQF